MDIKLILGLICTWYLVSGSGTEEHENDGLEIPQSLQRRSAGKAASIGGSKILECEINYPGGQWVENIISWRKQGIEVPIFIQFNGYPPHIDNMYQGRIRLVEQASVEISDILISDEGWYECSIIFLDNNEENNRNGTWTYLSVNSTDH